VKGFHFLDNQDFLQEEKQPQKSPQSKAAPVLTDINHAVTKIHSGECRAFPISIQPPRLIAPKVSNLMHPIAVIRIKLNNPDDHRIIKVGKDLQDHEVQPSTQHHHAS